MGRYKVADIAEALQNSKGFISTAAAMLGCTRKTIYSYIAKHPSLAEIVEDEKEKMKDFAESKLLQNIRDGKETSLIFYLKTQAKERGYIDKQQHEILVRNELEKALDALQAGLESEEYERVLWILARSDGSSALKALPDESFFTGD